MEHQLVYINRGSWEYPCTINESGDVEVRWLEQEILDINETSVFCNTCCQFVGGGDYIHKLREDWDAF